MRTPLGTLYALVIGALVPAFAQVSAGPPKDIEFNQVLEKWSRLGEDASILGEQGQLKGFSDQLLESLLVQNNRSITAIAILELKDRGNLAPKGQILSFFKQKIDDQDKDGRDPHDARPVKPDTALVLAAAQYLAATDKAAFLPSLMSRREVMAAPHWFAPAFQSMGKGWVRAALKSCGDDCDPALGYLVRSAATGENTAEVEAILADKDSDFWPDALAACERLNTASCWAALDRSIAGRSAYEVLTARMAQWRMKKTTAAALIAAAQAAVEEAADQPPGDERAFLLMRLNEFLRLAEWTKVAIPAQLASAIRDLGK